MNVQKIKIVPAKKTSRPERLTLKVPRFPRGDQPAVGEMLSPAHNCETDMPIYIDESQILNLEKDEINFRHCHADDWFERCWFMLGTIKRASSGIVWGMISRIFPAQNIKATSALFEFDQGMGEDELRRRIGALIDKASERDLQTIFRVIKSVLE